MNFRNKYVLAIDQGTTSSRAILFNHQGTIITLAQKPFQQYFPKPGWVEHDPNEIWYTQSSVIKEAMAKADVTDSHIACIGIANQRETTIIWDRETGFPVYNAIVWQCRRTAEQIDELKEKGYGPMLQKRTGLVPDAYFSASKIAWILDHVKGAREAAEKGELLFGTVDTWLIWNLTKGAVHVTDYTNAARTMLFDIHRCCWEEEILELFRIPKEMLPEVRPSSGFFGETQEQIFGGKIPVMGVAGDQQAALFGQCCFEKGDVKNTYGTGCFLLMHTGKEPIISRHGLLTTIAAGTAGEVEYALEGSVFVAGAAIQWLRDGMRMIRTAGQSEEYAKRVPDSNGVYIVPAFAGMGAPYWNPYARGTIVGLTRGCKKEHFIRATLESIAYQAKDVIYAMEEDAGVTLNGLRVDGGASANNMLVQFQADIIDAAVLRPECIETTALGAAYLAGLAAGYWKDRDEIRENWQLGRRFEPVMDSGERKKLLRGWQRAVRCARLWAEDGE